MNRTAIKVDDVSIRFNLSREKIDSLKEYIYKFLKRELKYDEFWALRNVSFELKQGDRLGILGLNGAGKSTLLKIIAGVYKPSTGTVVVRGKMAPMIAMGAGFDMRYTGKENIFLCGSALGLSTEFLKAKYDEIVEFSELGQFIDVPLKNYSSGMRTRLGFSIMTAIEPDILILDEVLSVGDAKFRKKSLKHIMDKFENGVTVLYVSHSLSEVKRLCNKAMILEHGQMTAFGDIEEVAKIYQEKIISR